MPVETVPLVLSTGRTLARAVVSEESIPADANSAMDGYAVRAEDTVGATVETPVRLAIIGEASAGSRFDGVLSQRVAVRIMTGGIVPEGASAVVEVEATGESDGAVEIRRSVRVGESIRQAGEDVRVGEEVIAEGKVLTPGDIGMLAALGVTNVPVRVKPKVGILSTGNELVESFRKPAPGEIRNSSSPALYAMCVQAGAEPIDLGIVGDDREELADMLEQGLRYDILLTTGGVSAGRYDLVQHVLPELGVDLRFHKVDIRPGKPILFGVYGDAPNESLVFALPGNPVSTLVDFRQFVLPAIRSLLKASTEPLLLSATCDDTFQKKPGSRHFIRGIYHRADDGSLHVRRSGTQSSGAMSSMSRANCLIILDEATERIEPGDRVDIELM
jgi:molybdopterin molybdotransferase